jgi:hypothetical protein
MVVLDIHLLLSFSRQQCLYFLPLPQRHRSFLPIGFAISSSDVVDGTKQQNGGIQKEDLDNTIARLSQGTIIRLSGINDTMIRPIYIPKRQTGCLPRIMAQPTWTRAAGRVIGSILGVLLAAQLLNAEPNHPSVDMVSPNSDTLHSVKDLRWSKRIILIRAAASSETELSALREEAEAIDERHIYWFLFQGGDLETNARMPIGPRFIQETEADYFDREDVDVVLIGKDGGVKARSGYLNLDDLFALIDTMPMRRSEMKRN